MRAVLAIILSTMLGFCAAMAYAAEEEKKQEKKEEEEKKVIVNYEVIQNGTYSGKKDATAQVIADVKTWEQLWKQHVSVLVPQPPVPEIDFESEVVVAIFAGEKKSGGYSVMIKDASAVVNDIVIKYRLTEPQPNSFTIQVITQPFIMLKMDKPAGMVKLEKI
jgi:hypothetical protein